MAWIDTMKLRRRADKLRAVGWLNLGITLLLCVVMGMDGRNHVLEGALWAGFVMALLYGAAMLIDRRAERVIGR